MSSSVKTNSRGGFLAMNVVILVVVVIIAMLPQICLILHHESRKLGLDENFTRGE